MSSAGSQQHGPCWGLGCQGRVADRVRVHLGHLKEPPGSCRAPPCPWGDLQWAKQGMQVFALWLPEIGLGSGEGHLEPS